MTSIPSIQSIRPIPLWKWSFGEPQEKTPIIRGENAKTPILEDDVVPPPTEYTRRYGLRNVVDTEGVENGKQYTQQEVLYNRMNNREQIVQIGKNPFHQTDYIHDIEIQDRFLRGKVPDNKTPSHI